MQLSSAALLLPLVALCVQYAISSVDVSLLLPAFASLRSALEPAAEPEHQPLARTEADINEQQRRSAERLAQLGPDAAEGASLVQPEEIRRQSLPLQMADSMRCGQKLPPESAWITRGVEIFVRSRYAGVHGSEHTWRYTVSFRNQGVDTVQMLTRHWIFADSATPPNVHEMQGPGARGVTPVLAPGDSWEYESGTSLRTSTGSMHGSFEFATLRDVSGARPLQFSAPVARLALSADDGGGTPPCGAPAAAGELPTSSVRATRRVIVGASARYLAAASHPEQRLYRFVYDVQLNNARASTVRVVGHRWSVATSVSATSVTEMVVAAGGGAGGRLEAQVLELPPGEATRIQGLLTASSPHANAWGTYTVQLSARDGAAETRVETGVETGNGKDTVEEIEVEIGALGLSVDDEAVLDLRELRHAGSEGAERRAEER